MDSRTQKNHEISSDEWYTPKWLIDCLGPFGLDPCAPMIPPFKIAERTYNIQQNGLGQEWPTNEIVWLNPPYNSKLIKQFVMRLAEQNNGIAILINRTDNLLFQEVIFPKAKSMLFMRHKVHFINQNGKSKSPMYGSVLIAFGEECDKRLRECRIDGKYVRLN